jgi:hypothetical protein
MSSSFRSNSSHQPLGLIAPATRRHWPSAGMKCRQSAQRSANSFGRDAGVADLIFALFHHRQIAPRSGNPNQS